MSNTKSYIRAAVVLAATIVNAGFFAAEAAPLVPSGLSTIWSFKGPAVSASNVTVNNGSLYGTSEFGGPSRSGTVFETTPAAKGKWTTATLYTFAGGSDGSVPAGAVTFDANGVMYGSTSEGGSGACGFGCGTIFQLNPPAVSGGAWTKTILYNFADQSDGQQPRGTLVFGNDGALYGVSGGGVGNPCSGCGTVFRLAPPAVAGGAWTHTVLYTFSGSDGSTPAGVVLDQQGNLYGATSSGGPSQNGTIFELSPPAVSGGAWTLTTLYAFTGNADGGSPGAGVVFGSDGALYGTAQLGGAARKGVVFRLAPPAVAGGSWTETVLHSFTGYKAKGMSDGAKPGALVFGAIGAIFGTTLQGGKGPCAVSGLGTVGCGTAFELAPPASPGGDWTETVLHSFNSAPDGSQPMSAALLANGSVVGVTYNGGYNGTLFKLTPPARSGPWTEAILYSFGLSSDGFGPYSGVVADAKGDLYGTIYYGGTGACLNSAGNFTGCGAVYRLTPPARGKAWKESLLYSFAGGSDGEGPYGGLVFDQNGIAYGTTYRGGANNLGTVFQLAPPAKAGGPWKETVLYQFQGGTDGSSPTSALVIDTDGALYGTTQSGGTAEQGTVFQLSPPAAPGDPWTESVLYRFKGKSDGQDPYGVVFQGGTLYGVTYGEVTGYKGHSRNNGTVFMLTPPAVSGGAWTETPLYYFAGGSDGTNPNSGLVFDSQGAIYGVTAGGGSPCANYGCGVVFQLSPPAVAGGVWTESVLYSFAGAPDGSTPDSLVFNGTALEGATNGGGSSAACGKNGCGTLFELTPPSISGGAWTEQALQDFGGVHGINPQNVIVHQGSLLGTTYGSGAFPCSAPACGTVFQATF